MSRWDAKIFGNLCLEINLFYTCKKSEKNFYKKYLNDFLDNFPQLGERVDDGQRIQRVRQSTKSAPAWSNARTTISRTRTVKRKLALNFAIARTLSAQRRRKPLERQPVEFEGRKCL